MTTRADLVTYDKDGQLALVVEVKNKTGTSSVWAANMRRNILAHGLLPNMKFFLLALPDRFYLWRSPNNTPEIRQPDYEIDSTLFLEPYYKQLGLLPSGLGGASFELVIASWVSQLTQIDRTSIPQGLEWLEESGLFDVLVGGRVVSEAAI
jgi:hypothetical protein